MYTTKRFQVVTPQEVEVEASVWTPMICMTWFVKKLEHVARRKMIAQKVREIWGLC